MYKSVTCTFTKSRPPMDGGGGADGWRPIGDLIRFFERAAECTPGRRAMRADMQHARSAEQGAARAAGVCSWGEVLQDTPVSARERRMLFEERTRQFRSEILAAAPCPAQRLRDSEIRERSQRQRILQQRRDAGRNKTIVTSHIAVLLRGRERDDGVLRPSMLDTKGEAEHRGVRVCPRTGHPGLGI